MEINLDKLKCDFNIIKETRNKITIIFTILETHLNKLKQTYLSFITNNTQNLFIFGLDSFQFQSKLLDIEYDDMTRLFLAINNKMYCEYYKLYKIIVAYVTENISNKKTLEMIQSTNFPIYKDLEPFKQYNFELIQEIHENIILLLYSINDFVVIQDGDLQKHKKKQQSGLNINNFVTTVNYNILLIREKGILFMSYIHFFHSLHTKYLQRFSMKINLLYSQITHDINFDESISSLKNEMLHKFEECNIDKDLIDEIKRSVEDNSIQSELTNVNVIDTNIIMPQLMLTNVDVQLDQYINIENINNPEHESDIFVVRNAGRDLIIDTNDDVVSILTDGSSINEVIV
jgi:hypothetical protein